MPERTSDPSNQVPHRTGVPRGSLLQTVQQVLRLLYDSTILKLIIVGTTLYWIVLFFKIPIFQSLRDWFWVFTDTPVKCLWLFAFVLGASYLVLAVLLKQPQRWKINLLLLILLGYFMQMSFGLLEGRGIEALRERLITRGHAEFARVAARETDLIKVATQYESLAHDGILGDYPRSKPPGALLFYMLTQKASALFFTPTNPEQAHLGLITLATFLYPLLTYLVLFPLYALSRIFLDNKLALLACAFYLFFPNVELINYHLDQMLYPLLFISSLFLISFAYHRKSVLLAFLAGLLTYLSAYVTFSLFFIIPMVFLISAIFYFKAGLEKRTLGYYLKIIAVYLAGLLATAMLFRIIFHYDLITRYQNAMAFHLQWKNWQPSWKQTLFFAFESNLEFACWIGLPASILCLICLYRTVAELAKKHLTSANLWVLAVSLLFILLTFFSKTKNESGRLWLFMVPLVSTLVVYEITRRFQNRSELAFKIIIFLQLITTLIIKIYQDS